MMGKNIQPIQQNKVASFKLSLWFFVFVLLLTAILAWYNLFLSKENNTLLWDIESNKKIISQLKKNKEVQVATLLSENRSILEKMEKDNNIVAYINHVRSLERAYSVKFHGFSFGNWKLQSELKFESQKWEEITAMNTSQWIKKQAIAYQEVVRFIRDYRANKESIFDLSFVAWIEGNDNISFPVSFILK